MLDTTIVTGPVEVITSGTVIAFENNPIDITVPLTNFNMTISFHFKDDEGENIDPSADFEAVSSTFLKVTLNNFTNNLGSGSKTPIRIARHQDKQVYIQFRVYSLNKKNDKTLHFTIYRSLEKEESVDESTS